MNNLLLRYQLRLSPKPLISTRARLGLLWSAKAGCTFASKWFFYHAGLLEEARAFDRWIHNYRKHYYSSRIYYRSLIKIGGIRWVKIVRSPWDRAVSSYFHALLSSYEDQGLNQYLGRLVDRHHGFSFEEFIHYLEQKDLSKANIHHKMQYHPSEAFIPELKVIKLENSMVDIPVLERECGLNPSPLEDLKISGHHSRRSADIDEAWHLKFERRNQVFPLAKAFYTSELRDLVYGIYQSDFTKYGYG